ncbi:MAG: desulfoferrodoxin [Planctomycetota bacterium]
MAERSQVYKCEACGNIIEVLDGGDGELICCGEPMKLMKENSVDASKEKHVPVREADKEGVKVKVGSVPHPMEAKHYIEWVEVATDDRTCRKYLKPGDAPEAVFCAKKDKVVARAYCNLHGLWKG